MAFTVIIRWCVGWLFYDEMLTKETDRGDSQPKHGLTVGLLMKLKKEKHITTTIDPFQATIMRIT